jgi:photosystem II stability/assembly factor-like uncharacterized protein
MPAPTTVGDGSVSGDNNSALTSRILFDPSDGTGQTLLAFGGSHRGAGNDEPGQDDTPTTKFGNGLVWRSTNGGDSWAVLASMPSPMAIFTAGFSGSRLYVAARYGGVLRSDDRGAHWTNVSGGGVSSNNTWWIAVHPTDGNTVWAISYSGDIFKTTNGGSSWTKVHTGAPGTQLYFTATISVSKLNPNILYAGTPEGVLMSSDGGNNWTTVLTSAGMNDPTKLVSGTAYVPYLTALFVEASPADPTGNTAMVGAGAAYILTTNRGATWVDKSSTPAGSYGGYRGNGYNGQVSNGVSWNPYHPEQMFSVAGDFGKIVYSRDYTWSWLARAPSGVQVAGGANAVSYSADGTIFIATGQVNGGYAQSDPYPPNPSLYAILKSTDYGATWGYKPFPSGVSLPTKAVYVHPTNSNRVWAGVHNSLLYSSNGGDSWTNVLPGISTPYSIVPDPTNPLTFYVGAGCDGMYKTTDGQNFSPLPNAPASCGGLYIAVDPVNPSTLYASRPGPGGGVFKSTNGGGTWTHVLSKDTAEQIAIDPGNHLRLAVTSGDVPNHDLATSEGAFISSDGGNTWTALATGLQVTSSNPVSFNPDKSAQLVIGLVGGGLFVTDVGNSTPFGSSPIDIPGTVQVENYDNGGADVAYHAAGGAPSRSSVTGLVAHDWIKYRANVAAGTYNITIHGSGGTAHLEMNGVNITGPQSLNGDTVIPGVELAGGTQYLKLYVESGSTSVDYIQFN